MTLEKGNFILIDKPIDWTSFDVVNYIRKQHRAKNPENKKIKVGHAGTLDPFASGLLIIGIGRDATKRLDEFKDMQKTYLTTIHLGYNSDTDDSTGKITEYKNDTSIKIPTEKEVKKVLQNFEGEQKQIPPMYSAKKIEGTRLYKLARAGKTIERQPNIITIFSIKFLSYNYPKLEIEVVCSTGTYIRTLSRDIGETLKTGGYCDKLRRTKIGKYNVENAKMKICKIKNLFGTINEHHKAFDNVKVKEKKWYQFWK